MTSFAPSYFQISSVCMRTFSPTHGSVFAHFGPTTGTPFAPYSLVLQLIARMAACGVWSKWLKIGHHDTEDIRVCSCTGIPVAGRVWFPQRNCAPWMLRARQASALGATR